MPAVTVSIMWKYSYIFRRLLQSIIAQNTILGKTTVIDCIDLDALRQYST